MVIRNFFDKSRIVADSEMQILWSRVLASEANAPGTYSKRAVNFLSDLDKTEASLFSRLCGFCWNIAGEIPLIFDTRAEIYNISDMNFETLCHLESIGFIHFNGVGNFTLNGLSKTFMVTYFGMALLLDMPKNENNSFNIGHVRFTKIGQELRTICDSEPVDGFFDYVMDRWKEYNARPLAEVRIIEE